MPNKALIVNTRRDAPVTLDVCSVESYVAANGETPAKDVTIDHVQIGPLQRTTLPDGHYVHPDSVKRFPFVRVPKEYTSAAEQAKVIEASDKAKAAKKAKLANAVEEITKKREAAEAETAASEDVASSKSESDASKETPIISLKGRDKNTSQGDK